MIITEKQLICLLQTLKDTLIIMDRIDGHFTLNISRRYELYNRLLSQQSGELISRSDLKNVN